MLHAVKCRNYHPTLVSMKEGIYADGINLGYVAGKVDYILLLLCIINGLYLVVKGYE